jgi:hypothetical protein
MAIEYPPCRKEYFTNWRNVGVQFNAIPVTGLEGAGGFTMYFPRPFMILGLCTLEAVPTAPPNFIASRAALNSNADQNTYKDLFPSLFISLCFANTQPYVPEGGSDNLVQYVEPGPQGTDWRYYFSKFLNDQVVYDQKEQVYNVLIQPESTVWQFWASNVATAADLTQLRYLDLQQKIVQGSDLRLWGAPGVYNIWPGNPASVSYQPRMIPFTLNDD